jgi:hypothetical protein
VTSFHHQPEAQHPKSSAIHKLPADYPIFGSLATEPFSAITGLERGPLPQAEKQCLAAALIRRKQRLRIASDGPFAYLVLAQVEKQKPISRVRRLIKTGNGRSARRTICGHPAQRDLCQNPS